MANLDRIQSSISLLEAADNSMSQPELLTIIRNTLTNLNSQPANPFPSTPCTVDIQNAPYLTNKGYTVIVITSAVHALKTPAPSFAFAAFFNHSHKSNIISRLPRDLLTTSQHALFFAAYVALKVSKANGIGSALIVTRSKSVAAILNGNYNFLFSSLAPLIILFLPKGEYINDGRLSVVSDLLISAIREFDHVKGVIFDKSFRGKNYAKLREKTVIFISFDQSISTGSN